MKHIYWGLLPLASKSFTSTLFHFSRAMRFRMAAQCAVGAFVEEPTVELFATHCFIEFVADGKLQSASSSLPLVPPTSATLARAGNVAVTPPQPLLGVCGARRFDWQGLQAYQYQQKRAPGARGRIFEWLGCTRHCDRGQDLP